MTTTPPRTPRNQTSELPGNLGNQCTPYSKGMASTSHLNDLRRKTTGPWLVEDVSNTANASVLKMLAFFTQRIMSKDLKKDPKDMLEDIVNKIKTEVTNATSDREHIYPVTRKVEEMKQAHKKFLNKRVESETYVPFVTMTNAALGFLKTLEVEGTTPYDATHDILLHQNDPNLLSYSYNKGVHRRKPDNIFVSLDTARALHNKRKVTSWDDIVTKYAKKAREGLDWGDALCSIEHKRTQRISQKSWGKLKLEEGSLLPLKDLDRFVPKRSSQNRSRDTVSEADENLFVRKTRSKKDGPVRTTGSSHARAESRFASQVHMHLQDDINWENSVAIQSAEYGLGRLCCSYDMLHAFNLIVVDGVLHISWYDREGIITTNGFSLSKYLEYYLALLYIFQRFDRSGWGRWDDNLRNKRNTKESTVSFADGKDFTFDPTNGKNVLHKPFSIGGRATTVYACQGIGEREPGHVIKFNWKEESRLSEWKILEEIGTRVRQRVEQEKEASYIARISTAFQNRVQNVLDEDDSLLSYLPEEVAGMETDNSTKTIRDYLRLESQPRRLVIIVFVKLDGMISGLNGKEYWQVFWDCFRCHKRLWKLGIHHRDISNDNMMFFRKDSHVFGILIDFDLATLEGELSQNQRRTGTRPFMARKQLVGGPPVRHLYKYDAEAFFWVAVYDSASPPSVHEWGNLDNSALAREKSTYLFDGFEAIPMADKWENHRPMRQWLDQTRDHFFLDSRSSKDWGVDELYNVLRGFREDKRKALPGAHQNSPGQTFLLVLSDWFIIRK